MQSTLPISRLIDVAVNLEPAAAQAQSLSTLLILGTSTVIDVVTRMRTYTTLDEVAADFGTSAEEYLAAVLWFEQTPQPTSLFIGRWAKNASHGQLFCAPLTATQQTALLAVANGAFHVTVDGGAASSIVGLDFTAQTNMNGVATIISAALTGATCTWNATLSCFVFQSNSTGASSTISFLTAGASGTDISGMLGGLNTSSGAYQAAGILAESALACVTLFDNQFGQQWYAVVIPSAIDSDHEAVAPFIEGTNTKHFYGITSNEAGILSSVSTTDIAYILKGLKYKRTMVQYSSTNLYAVVSALARILTTDYNANNSVITLMYKQEPGITAENLTSTQIAVLEGKNCNVFVAYNNNTAIIETGVCCSGDFVDEVMGVDWLAITIQTALFNLLYLTPTKIPQTDAGTHLLVTTIANVCSQAVINGLLGPGSWTSQGFGTLKQGDPLPAGFYIYAPPLANQSSADRGARKSVPIQVAAKLAGAVHTVDVTINVNR